MAKSKGKTSGRPNPAVSTRPQGAAPEAVKFGFNRFSVLKVVFQEVSRVPLADGEPVPQGYGTQMGLNVTVGVNDAKVAEVRIAASVVPDPKVKPYNIQVEVVGVFSTKNGTAEQLAEFCRQMGPTIMFPYIRELVDRTTHDGRYGEVRLDPMNLQQALSQNPWAIVPSTTETNLSASTESEPPSEQSRGV